MDFNKLSQQIKEKKCELLTTEKECQELCLTKSIHHIKITIKSQCGHNNICVVTNFLTRNTGILCKDCQQTKIINQLKECHKNNPTRCQQTEYDGFQQVSTYLEPFFEIKKTNEGCLADFMIREHSCEEDKWIAVQLKTTTKMNLKMYTFRGVNKQYTNHLIMCNCLEENKLWVLPFHAISHLKNGNLNISEKSKYNLYLVTDKNVYEYIIKLIPNIRYFTLEECMKPQSPQQIQEYEYVNIRKEHLPYIDFITPNLENGKVDFYINHLKIQEKNSYRRRHRQGDYICIAVNNGKTDDKKRKYRTYRYNEIDFYWFNIKPTFIFYVIPQEILLQHSFISNENETLNKTYLNINKNQEWLEQYKFDYKNVDKERFFQILGI